MRFFISTASEKCEDVVIYISIFAGISTPIDNQAKYGSLLVAQHHDEQSGLPCRNKKTNLFSPRVSIGMPVFNGEPYLEKALRSLLSQTFPDFELIVSNNASTDRTGEICATMPARTPEYATTVTRLTSVSAETRIECMDYRVLGISYWRTPMI